MRPGLWEVTVDLEAGQFAGDLLLVPDGNENDLDAGIDLFHCFCQPDAAKRLRPKLDLGQQHIAALGLGKGQGGIGTVKAVQFRVRDNLRDLLLDLFLRISAVVHMDDLHGIRLPDMKKRAAPGAWITLGVTRL